MKIQYKCQKGWTSLFPFFIIIRQSHHNFFIPTWSPFPVFNVQISQKTALSQNVSWRRVHSCSGFNRYNFKNLLSIQQCPLFTLIQTLSLCNSLLLLTVQHVFSEPKFKRNSLKPAFGQTALLSTFTYLFTAVFFLSILWQLSAIFCCFSTLFKAGLRNFSQATSKWTHWRQLSDWLRSCAVALCPPAAMLHLTLHCAATL